MDFERDSSGEILCPVKVHPESGKVKARCIGCDFAANCKYWVDIIVNLRTESDSV